MKSLLALIIAFSEPLWSMEESRPLSSGNDQLIEFNFGEVRVKGHEVFEAGIDYEVFTPGFDHHLSFGVASEIEFLTHDEFYLGPMVSLYFFHTKLFYTSGVQTDFKNKTFWKNRLGLGYEYLAAEHLIFVPTIAVDRSEGEFHRAINLGIALEF